MPVSSPRPRAARLGALVASVLAVSLALAAAVVTLAGKALSRVRSGMAGTPVGTPTERRCSADRPGIHACLVRYRHGVGRIYWNPYRARTVTLAHSATPKGDELGRTRKVAGGTRVKVGAAPVLVRSST